MSGRLTTPGMGVRMRTDSRAWIRADVAHGPAGFRLSFSLNAAVLIR
jgi:hypothetical protein